MHKNKRKKRKKYMKNVGFMEENRGKQQDKRIKNSKQRYFKPKTTAVYLHIIVMNSKGHAKKEPRERKREVAKMKKKIAMVLALGMALTAGNSVACLAAENDGEDASGKTLKIGVSWSQYNDALYYSWGEGLEKVMNDTCKEHGYDSVEFVNVVAENDASKQANDISDLITQDCDAIITYAFDNQAIASSIEEAHKAEIPIILWDRDQAKDSSPEADLYVGLDTYKQAYEAGKAFFQKMIDAGEEPTEIISIIGATNDNNALNRQKGFEDAAAEFDLEIAQTVPSDWDSEKALTGFTAAWQAHPNSNCVLIASDFIVTAVQTVLESNDAWYPQGEEDHVWICSQDGYPTGVKFMQDGYMDMSGMYNVDGMCENFANSVYALVEGTYDGEQKLYTEPMVVDAADMDSLELWGANYMEEAAE